MRATGLDIGGTKIETRVFDADWSETRRQRVPTPSGYDALVQTVAEQIAWAAPQGGPVGIGCAGIAHPKTGILTAANLAANGQTFAADIARAADLPVHFINDARAFGLSEAVFGAGKDYTTVAAVILGTGIGGAVIVKGSVMTGPTVLGGEFGHTAAPAHIIARHNLPIFTCGCGRPGCIETYISGRGLTDVARYITGTAMAPQDIVNRTVEGMAAVRAIWMELLADFILRLTLTLDPDVIVLGGGLSQVDGLCEELLELTQAMQIEHFDVSPLVIAQDGDASGARGAAYAAWQAQGNG